MTRNPSKISFDPEASMSYVDFFRYIQGSTNEILTILDGMEKELDSRKRIRKRNHKTNQRATDFYKKDIRKLDHSAAKFNHYTSEMGDRTNTTFYERPEHSKRSTEGLTAGSPATQTYMSGDTLDLSRRRRHKTVYHNNNQRYPYDRDVREPSHTIQKNQELSSKLDEIENEFNEILRHSKKSKISLSEWSPKQEMYRYGDTTYLNSKTGLENYYHNNHYRISDPNKRDMRGLTYHATDQNQELGVVEKAESKFKVTPRLKNSKIDVNTVPQTKNDFRSKKSIKLGFVRKVEEEAVQDTNIVSKANFDGPCSYIDFNPNHPEVKWHQGFPGYIPQNATKIGFTKTGTSLYAGRAWNEDRSFLVPAFINFDEAKCYFGKNGQLWASKVFEVMESNSVAWHDAIGSPVTELPRFAFKAGYNENDEPLYFGRAFIDGAFTPGYIEETDHAGDPSRRAFALYLPFRNNILRIFDTYEVMVVLPSIKL